MNKKGPLSKVEKEFIDNAKDKDANKIAKSLNRTLRMVQSYLDENKNLTSVKKPDSMDLFARKKDRGVVVMTESASRVSDENKKKTQLPKRYDSIIHKIKEE